MFSPKPTLLENVLPFREEPGNVPIAVSLRNACFDNVFYDTTNLTNAEKAELLSDAFACEEGGMLYVYPSPAEREIEYISLSHDLVQQHPDLDTVTIPGVGSSVIGTASLARQVANAIGRPAVGIIAGYGAADMISEALGGWFYFGIRNRVSAILDDLKRLYSEQQRATISDRAIVEEYKVKSTTFFVDEPESNTLLNIMLRHAQKLRLIVGHSKGALNIQNVLRAFLNESELNADAYKDMTIVTLGCGVAIPPEFRNVHQYLGTWDILGNVNTPIAEQDDPTLKHVAAKAHNLCSFNPFHMPVEELLREALVS